ncbi:MAG: hypothetical protein ABSG54_04570 [Terriglobia bacterium]
MTIAIGLLSEDGIVLASDTKYRTNGNVQYGEKIYPLQVRPWLRVVVAGAGPVGFIRAASQKIEDALPHKHVSLSGISAIIETTNKNFYEQYVIANRQSAALPNYGLLVGIFHKPDGFILLHTTENSTAKVDDIEPEGTGGIVAEPYKSLWREEMPTFEAELAAIFMVKHAKTYDADNCGGDTRVFTLVSHEILTRLEDGYIDLAERYFTEFNELSLQMLLPSQTGEMDKELFDGDLKGIVEKLQHYRDDLNRYRPHAYRIVP